jgi:hypothetical protein
MRVVAFLFLLCAVWLCVVVMMIYGVFEHVAVNKPVMAALIAAGTAFLASLVSFRSWWRIHADRWSIRWPGRSDPVDFSHGTHLMVEAKPRPEDVRFLEECLYEFNARATGISDGKLLSLFVRPDRSPIGRRLWLDVGRNLLHPLQRTCVGTAKALCLCAQHRRRPILGIAGRSYLKPLTFKHLPSTKSSALKKSGASKIIR